MGKQLSALLLFVIFLTTGVVAGQAFYSVDEFFTYLPIISVSAASLSGMVVDASGPVPGAVVRVQATDNATTSDENGRFTLQDITGSSPVRVTAWANGYYIGGGFEYRLATLGLFLESGFKMIQKPRIARANVKANHFRTFPIQIGINIYFGG